MLLILLIDYHYLIVGLGSEIDYDNWLTTFLSPALMTQGGSQDFASRFPCRTISSLGFISIFW